jgi:hypothetical protein
MMSESNLVLDKIPTRLKKFIPLFHNQHNTPAENVEWLTANATPESFFGKTKTKRPRKALKISAFNPSTFSAL